MKKYSRTFGVGGMVLSIAAVVVGLGMYRNTLDMKASNQLAVVSTPVTTQVLGTTDSQKSSQFFVSGITVDQKGSESVVTLVAKNSSLEKFEFSPGLQLFAVLEDGSEVSVSGLGDLNPLEGGPMNPGQIVLGSVKYALQKDQIKYMRLYNSAEKTSHTDTDTK